MVLIRGSSAQGTSPYIEFESGEEINNWLLANPEVRAHMSRPASHGQRPKVAMVFFDAETERICDELGYDLILPSAELREHLDSKLVTTRLGNDVGAASVPNVLVTVEEYDELLEAARGAGLGSDLVVQTAYGDSGKITFFIDDETGWKRHRRDISGNELRRRAGLPSGLRVKPERHPDAGWHVSQPVLVPVARPPGAVVPGHSRTDDLPRPCDRDGRGQALELANTAGPLEAVLDTCRL
jgi:hypothetical protein